MVRLTFIFSVILLFQTIGFGQDVCVEIKAEPNADIFPSGQTILFKAVLSKKIKAENLKFIWNTSNGISKTENSDSFSLETKKDSKDESIKIFLEIEGLPQNCLRSYERKVTIVPPPIPVIDLDRFPNNLPWNDEKWRLSSYVKELKEQKTSSIYIVISTRNPKSKKLTQRKLRIISYLTKDLQVEKKESKL